ncbi:Glucose-1-phosphate cytidylyltransferase [Symmachiella macrocystis]|uniref:Glucose-1-phosphate cytidylyltransferase n=1 Tax=Symmachiella macrocystis TaxID=2527985 RepID=A0A5C6BC01_9PLAN|nr:glucose-1-phosphate cytidylyltransferase [Symmachiella macrocystis]TWU09603.1 Glucose-1-phosphate cytidylyltransferase [Symmachiella macrocystis]
MKVVVLAGGLGTRLAEETARVPKPMVEIGGQPILWHLLRYYAAYGHREFLIAAGYKSEVIKDYFCHFDMRQNDLFVNLSQGTHRVVRESPPDWEVGIVDTGAETMTGGRLARLRKYLDDDTFMVTYGDGLSDVDISQLLKFHRQQGRLATVTAVRPPARFGHLELDGDRVATFAEKPQTGEGWINGGFFVFEPEVLDYIIGDETKLEAHALERIAADGQLAAFRHDGFWQPMDTLREKQLLESIWKTGTAPWMVNSPSRDAGASQNAPPAVQWSRTAG